MICSSELEATLVEKENKFTNLCEKKDSRIKELEEKILVQGTFRSCEGRREEG